MAGYDDDGEDSGFGKFVLAGLLVAAIAGGVFFWLRSNSSSPTRQPAPQVVQLKLIPPPPPPPPPKVPPPEPQKVVETPKMAEPMKPVTPTAAPKAPGPPPAGPLGLDAKGAGPGDAFGLHGGGGGDGSGEGGGGGTIEGYYASQVKSALDECVAEDGRLAHAVGRVRFVVWVDATGTPTRLSFENRFNDSRDSTTLEDIVLHHCKVDSPPRADLREIHVQLGATPQHS